ncbi:twin-arginine translocation signal domain-containing protein [Halopelagius fulvigenes]|uniref:Twin-arginine translocation signal domain-containing protein n=1 Tax=Halopelagius fulvigenes TaxID=1198324 RepID=A0ABD5TWR2_9EURY
MSGHIYLPMEENSHRESRRDFMKKSALTSGALAVGLTGSATAQETGTTNGTGTTTGTSGDVGDGGKALMFNDEFRPGAQFRVVSPVLEQNPDVEGVEQGDIWSEYNTRRIQYLNTNEEVYFFPAHDAEIQEGTVYELQTNFSLFADETNDEGVISVSFEPVSEDDVLISEDDGQLDPNEDFEIVDGGGKALVRAGNFYPGSLVQITSDVLEWTPRQQVQGSDIFSAYNTRHAEYLNTNDEFPIYTAHDGEFEPDAVYVMRNEFDVTDPEGALLTVDLDRVNQDDLDDGFF